MASSAEISAWLDELLNIAAFPGDASNNGLQYDSGNDEVRRMVFGVDGCADLFHEAAERMADMVFVHHGISWGGSLKRIARLDANRISILSDSDISLYAAHLPLDAHPKFGNNAGLAELAGLRHVKPFAKYSGYDIGFCGDLPKKMKVSALAELFDRELFSSGDWTIIGGGDRTVSRIGIVSGGGAVPGFFNEMQALGIDCLVTGEFGHEAYHYAEETGIAAIALGHYRTETVGPLSVMEQVREKFGIDCVFVDLPTGL